MFCFVQMVERERERSRVPRWQNLCEIHWADQHFNFFIFIFVTRQAQRGDTSMCECVGICVYCGCVCVCVYTSWAVAEQINLMRLFLRSLCCSCCFCNDFCTELTNKFRIVIVHSPNVISIFSLVIATAPVVWDDASVGWQRTCRSTCNYQ